MADTVRVLIAAKQTVFYRQITEMSREEWDELKNTPERDLEDEGGPLSGYINLRKIDGGGDFSDFDLVVVDEKGNPVRPADKYTG